MDINHARWDLVRMKLAPLAPVFADTTITEIVVNHPGSVWIKRRGAWHPSDVALSPAQVEGAITIIAGGARKTVGPAGKHQIVGAPIPGFRVEAVMPPTSIDGPSLCMRRHAPQVFTLDDYIAQGVLDNNAANFLRKIVADRENILIAGSTDSGKTTFFNSLVQLFDPAQRVVTIEIVSELQLSVPNVSRFEANEELGVSVRSLVRTSLRYCPDRILVGEVRGGEAYDLLLAANTGHRGSIATLHANSALDALSQFEQYAVEGQDRVPLMSVRMRIASTFRYVVFMARRGGDRRVEEILCVEGFDPERQDYVTRNIFSLKESHS